MEIVNGIYHNTVELNSHDVDTFNLVHPAHYFRVLQEASGSHAYLKGVGIPHLRKEGMTWVVTRTRMEIYHYLSWPATIEVETWPQGIWKFYYPRVCRANSKDGNPLFEAMSQWLVVDTETQRPQRNERISNSFDQVDKAFYKDPELGPRHNGEREDLPLLYTYTPRIVYSDVDLNHHVNNVVYLEWMLESLPFTFRDNYLATVVDISYRAQAFRDDEVTVTTKGRIGDKGASLFHSIESSEGIIIATAESEWRAKAQ